MPGVAQTGIRTLSLISPFAHLDPFVYIREDFPLKVPSTYTSTKIALAN